ncbi:MAG: Y-family DNA polymerase [Rhodospirillales bacterium]
MPDVTRIFALADANNFYAACERVFQPELRGKPTVVLSNNDGCVIARSPEAKAMGIAMGAPFFKLKERADFRHVQVRSANFTLYGDMSRRFMDIIAANTPDMEIYSIDECFIDYTRAGAAAADRARDLRATILQWTGLSVSFGLGATKTLAKIANRQAKASPDGVFALLDAGTQARVLGETDVEDVWGIGRQWANRLRLHGIENAFVLAQADRQWARNVMGVVGLRTVDELNGLSAVSLEHAAPDKQTLCVSRSFGTTVRDRAGLASRLRHFAARAAEKLRQGRLVAGAVNVYIRGNPFRPELPQYASSVTVALPLPTSDTGDIVRATLQGLDRLYRPGIPYKKAGVLMLEVCNAKLAPRSLFAVPDPRRARLMQTMDTLNAKHGPGTLCYGETPKPRTWYMTQCHRSRRFTTHWQELPVARA